MTFPRACLAALLAAFFFTPSTLISADMQQPTSDSKPQAPSQPAAQTPRPTPEWVTRSNENAKLLLGVIAKFNPEFGSSLGIESGDEQVIDLTPGHVARGREALRQAVSELRKRAAAEKDVRVRQDLEIMIKAAEDRIRGSELQEKYLIPYVNVPQLTFLGLRSLLDEQGSPARRQRALARLRRYVGAEKGSKPVTVLAEEYSRSRFDKAGVQGPFKGEVEKDLGQQAFFVEGIGQLFAKFHVAGYEEAYSKLKEQLAEYEQFVRKEILPRARTDFRLPPPLYAFRLEEMGIDIPPQELATMAHQAFNELQKGMQALALRIARAEGLASSDYRDVIRALKKDQLEGDAILKHYESRIASIEDIIRREHLVTLPNRPLRIRLASEAESANVPAPNMRPPRLIGNTGETGIFILPLKIPAPPGAKPGATLRFDDFTFAAASWTLTAHEGRPGHELQFDSMVEQGVSVPRAIFAANSVNVEGWGLYSEAILFPYMPSDGQLISLQHRMMRAARAFLDPELQSGKATPEQAKRVLMDDVVLSEAMANQEVERYMFWAPAQAPSYFYGYTRLMELRHDAEKALGPKFNVQRFHDFVLEQGLLPPKLLRRAVMEEFIPAEQGKAVPK